MVFILIHLSHPGTPARARQLGRSWWAGLLLQPLLPDSGVCHATVSMGSSPSHRDQNSECRQRHAKTSWISPGGWDVLRELIPPQGAQASSPEGGMSAGLLTLQGEQKDTGCIQMSWSRQVLDLTKVSPSGSYLGGSAGNIWPPLPYSERRYPLRYFESICREFQTLTGKGPEQTDSARKLALLSARGWAGDLQPLLPASGFLT